jgi:hypothetical protein
MRRRLNLNPHQGNFPRFYILYLNRKSHRFRHQSERGAREAGQVLSTAYALRPCSVFPPNFDSEAPI